MGTCLSLEEGIPEGITEDPSTCFKVTNHVTIGKTASSHISLNGVLAITDSELKLYRKRTPAPIVWPFTCLRSYGFGNGTFFFESGRQCETGPSLFALRTKYCEQMARLFNMKMQTFHRAETRRRNRSKNLHSTLMDKKSIPDSVPYTQRNDDVVNSITNEEQYLVPVPSKSSPVEPQQYVNGEVMQRNGQQKNCMNTQQSSSHDYINISAFAETRRRNGSKNLYSTSMDQKPIPDSVCYSQCNDHINSITNEEQYLVPVPSKSPVPSQQYVNGDVMQRNWQQQNHMNTQQSSSQDCINVSAFDTASGAQSMPLPGSIAPSHPRLNYAHLDWPSNTSDKENLFSGLTSCTLNQYTDDDNYVFLPASPLTPVYINLNTSKNTNGLVANCLSSIPGDCDSRSRLNESLSGSSGSGMRSVGYSETSSLVLTMESPANRSIAQYTHIDSRKTKALAAATKPSSCDGQEGVTRKTRHDSAADTHQ